MSLERRRFPDKGTSCSVNPVQPSTSTSSSGRSSFGQPGLDQLPQPPSVHVVADVDDKFAVLELRLGGGVPLAGESFEELGLLGGERSEPSFAVDRSLDRPGELAP